MGYFQVFEKGAEAIICRRYHRDVFRVRERTVKTLPAERDRVPRQCFLSYQRTFSLMANKDICALYSYNMSMVVIKND